MRTLATVNLLALGALASNATYDYIVVGGGSSGIIVAERLAETNKSVLLIERGGPSAYSSGNTDTISWNNTITPFDIPAYGYSLREAVPSCMCTDTASNAGCVLGGGGAVNAEIFVHPQESDFAAWPAGWTWEDGMGESAAALYERNPGETLTSADGRRYQYDLYSILGGFLGKNGWTEVDAIKQPNEKHNVYSYPPFNVQNSRRAGSVMTYLPLAQALPNFTLQLHTKVLRVVRSGSLATGVEVERADGTREIINVAPNGGKVVLAAGSLSTPRVLFNSGIGPAEQLQIVANGTTGITLPPRAQWIELPVGKGLRDHPIMYINLNLTSPSANLSYYDATAPSALDIQLYNSRGSGLLAQGVQRLNFWSSHVGSADGGKRFFQGTVNSDEGNVIALKVYLTHGLTSEGTLGITADGNTTIVDKPWLQTEGDKVAAAEFLGSMLEMLQTTDAWVTSNGRTGAVLKDANATSLVEKGSFSAGAHFVRTARLGEVVDYDTKVLGTDNIFVVDASIHPDVPTGNTNAMVMVVAEHAVKKIIALDGAAAAGKDC